MHTYYNEHDKFAAAWLRELMKAGMIAEGEVDERNIQDVRAGELRGFTQCHFFAGIGVWSYALRQAGWPEDEQVWTGSCPCQPFSVSGKRAGASDERHLWPVWFRLIEESRPLTIFGEQVASDDGLAWLDLVSSDLERQDYTIGAVDTPACGYGAPHRRQRLYWMANSACGRTGAIQQQGRLPISVTEGTNGELADSNQPNASAEGIQRSGELGRITQDGGVFAVADSEHLGHDRPRRLAPIADSHESGERIPDRDSSAGSMADTECDGGRPDIPRRRSQRGEANGRFGAISELGQSTASEPRLERHSGHERDRHESGRLRENASRSTSAAGILNGFWQDAEWLWCRDQKYRPVESGTFPLAHGAPCRVGRLRGYGNALVAEQAIAFIKACREERLES